MEAIELNKLSNDKSKLIVTVGNELSVYYKEYKSTEILSVVLSEIGRVILYLDIV